MTKQAYLAPLLVLLLTLLLASTAFATNRGPHEFVEDGELCTDCHDIPEEGEEGGGKIASSGQGDIKLYSNVMCKICHRPLDKSGHPLGPGPQVDPSQLPRDGNNQLLCLDCHQGHVDHLLRLHSKDLCSSCHYTGLENQHPVGVVPKRPVPLDLPLNSEGKVVCQTCHRVHMDFEKLPQGGGMFGIFSKEGERTYFLRRDNKEGGLCKACHPER